MIWRCMYCRRPVDDCSRVKIVEYDTEDGFEIPHFCWCNVECKAKYDRKIGRYHFA